MRIKCKWVSLLSLFIIVSNMAVKDVSSEEKWSTVYDRYTYQDDAARFLDTKTFVVKEITSEPLIKKPVKENKITLYFDLGASKLRQSEIEKLNRLTSMFSHAPVKVLAYTGPLGSLKRNQVVADQRAEAISTWLKKNGVRVSSVQSKPNCCYVSKKALWKNRRVEIVFEKGGDRQTAIKHPIKTFH
jgi:outer membrane protein OmpA-like peptidoglycan-associated protein